MAIPIRDTAAVWLRTPDYWLSKGNWQPESSEERNHPLLGVVLDEFPTEALARHVRNELSIAAADIEPLKELHTIYGDDHLRFARWFSPRTRATFVVAGTAYLAQLVPETVIKGAGWDLGTYQAVVFWCTVVALAVALLLTRPRQSIREVRLFQSVGMAVLTILSTIARDDSKPLR